jgi:hypothetical protein
LTTDIANLSDCGFNDVAAAVVDTIENRSPHAVIFTCQKLMEQRYLLGIEAVLGCQYSLNTIRLNDAPVG